MEFPDKKELIGIMANEIYTLTSCTSWNQSQDIASKTLNNLIKSLPQPIEMQTTAEHMSMGLDGIIKTLFKRTEVIDNSTKFYKKLLSYKE